MKVFLLISFILSNYTGKSYIGIETTKNKLYACVESLKDNSVLAEKRVGVPKQ